MRLEDIIRKILSAKPELTREEVLKMIELKEKGAKGFLTRESAALSLAVEFGVAAGEKSFRREVQIKDLVSGLNDVAVTGRVIYASPIKKFIRQNGSESVKRIIHIADKTGVAKVALWDEDALASEPEHMLDRLVRLRHASVKRKAGGKLELNIGSKGEVEIDPEDLREEDYPPLTSFTVSLGKISGKEKNIDIIGLVSQIHPIITFKRQDSSEGKVRRVEIKNHTGKTTLILWDNNADAISEKHVGKPILVLGVGVKQRFDGRLELHTRNQTVIILLTKKPSGFNM
jgi:ssDNA-binding replication factor A large subunit